MDKYTIELVWNREFHWSRWNTSNDLEQAKKSAKDILYSGDGARVKKVRVIDSETEEVLWKN